MSFGIEARQEPGAVAAGIYDYLPGHVQSGQELVRCLVLASHVTVCPAERTVVLNAWKGRPQFCLTGQNRTAPSGL